MIKPKSKGMFQFIEYLHSNVENFNQYNQVIDELHVLDLERQKLNPRNKFKDKLEYEDVQDQIEAKIKVIQKNIIQPIRAKAKELNVCNFDNGPTYHFNHIEDELHEFSIDDLPEISKRKEQYIEFRTATEGKSFFELALFFDNLDEVLKSFFDYFKETDQNEFEPFETKVMRLPNHESIDFVGIAKMERENHNDRLIKWIEKRGGDMKREKYFIKDQLEQIEVDLSERNQFTVGPIWDMYKIERLEYKGFLEKRLKELEGGKSTPLQAPTISLFCSLINDAGIIRRGQNENVETFCERICEEYKLPYTDRVRQNFGGKKLSKNYKQMNELILPIIDSTTSDKITKHLANNNTLKSNLFA